MTDPEADYDTYGKGANALPKVSPAFALPAGLSRSSLLHPRSEIIMIGKNLLCVANTSSVIYAINTQIMDHCLTLCLYGMRDLA